MTILHVSPDAPALVRAAADAILFLHIGGGGLGILSGATALLTRKGARVHRAAGTVFFVSMLIAYTIAAAVSPFLDDGQRPNFVAGILALYLLLSAWITVKRHEMTVGRFEAAGFVIALLIVAAGALFAHMGSQDPTGTIDGSPPQAFYVFMTAGAFGAAGDLNMLLRRGLAGAARIARHLWRMCFSLFIASGSFFLGQQQVMPEWMRGSPLLIALALAPLAFMIFWLVRVRLTRWYGMRARSLGRAAHEGAAERRSSRAAGGV